jgi:GntR family galactonate operon transcriptional repressor
VSGSSSSVLRRDAGNAPPRNLREQVLDELGQLVVAGVVVPGATLPIEPALAAEFGVSKTVIREAIRGLAAKGLVQTSPRRGTVVCKRDDWHALDPDVLAWHLRADTNPNVLRDFEEFRRGVEPMCARLAAERATTADRQALRAAFEHMQSTVDTQKQYLAHDLDFHSALLMATENTILRGLRDAVRAALAVRHECVSSVLDDMREPIPYHERVLLAVEAGNADEAASAMEQLLALSMRDDARLSRGSGRRPASRARRPRHN